MTSTPHRSVDDGHDEKTSMKDGATTFDIDVNNLYESDDNGLDPVYYRKTIVLNRAIQEIGMGKYQVSNPRSITQMDCQPKLSTEVSRLYRRRLRVVCVRILSITIATSLTHPSFSQ